MTPKGRERAYEKRRYEEWQARLAARQARRRRQQRIIAVVGSAVVVVLVIVGGFALFLRDDDTSTAAAPTPSSTPSSAPSATASTAADAKLCPPSTVKAPASPKKFASAPKASEAGAKTWTWDVKTTCGNLTIALDGRKAPQAVATMVMLARAGFFDDTPCHRLTTTGIYVLQCGDPTGTGTGGPGFEYGPVENAPKDNVYKAGTVAMARQSGNGKSMGSQFFLVYKDSPIPADAAGGYTVLGTITRGLGVVDKAAAGGVTGGTTDGAPARAVSITSTTVKS